MTLYIHSVKRMRIYEEPNGSYGTDATTSPGLASFLETPFVEGTCTVKLLQPLESPMHSQQKLDGYPVEVPLPKAATMEVTMNLETFTTRAGNGVAAVQGALGLMLKVAMGGEQLGTGTTIASTSTSTSLVTTSASGILAGTAVGSATGSGSTLEMREVASKSSNTLALKLALSGAPSNGTTVYSAATYYMGGTDGSQTTSLQVAYEGLYTEDRFLLLGGYLTSMALTLGPGGIPQVKFSWGFANWLYGSATATAINSGTLGTSTYTNNNTIVQKDSELRQQTVGTSTYNSASTLNAPVIEFTPNIKYALHRTPGGVQTIKQPVRDRSAPVIAGAFVLPYEATTWFTARDASPPTVKAIGYQIGSSTANGAILICAPTVQITDVQVMAQDSITSTRVEWKGRLDTATSGSTTDLALSAFRIHLM